MVRKPSASKDYIPSPLGSPAAARRLGQRLGDRICSSPILSRVRRKWRDGEEQRRSTFCGLLGGTGGADSSPDEELNLYLWRQKGDAGRIAHRHAENKWDAW